MANKSELSLVNGWMYMLQVDQAVSLAGQHYSRFAASTFLNAIRLTLTCFVIYTMFKIKHFFRSQLMTIFIYVCLNDLLFALMGELKYSIIHFDIDIPCYVFVIFYFSQNLPTRKQ